VYRIVFRNSYSGVCALGAAFVASPLAGVGRQKRKSRVYHTIVSGWTSTLSHAGRAIVMIDTAGPENCAVMQLQDRSGDEIDDSARSITYY